MDKLEKLQKTMFRRVGEAIKDFHMIQDGDKIMVCLSGGKDSFTMLDMLLHFQKKAPIHFDLLAVNLDQKQPGFPEHILPEYLTQLGVPFVIVEQDTYSIVKRLIPEGKTTCSLCSRLRRGILYNTAIEHGCTKIALGHHSDDIMETFFLNLFYVGTLKAMPPILRSDDGRNTIIRPMAYCLEKKIAEYARERDFPIIPCDLCGSQENLKRKKVKNILKQLENEIPRVKNSILAGFGRIQPSHMLDKTLYDFKNFEFLTGDVEAELDDALGFNHNEHEMLHTDPDRLSISLPVL
ncbi:MAG TPA: tRNA 2-thiocytidine(32) synthetase TtcA [Acidobacteriota bacterium]|nr:tRNA 2-thiocytidine(32) synthetase TtcA [Acidobacteriota bacterium]HNB73630.1 tRNA 2-thiocytidine(32) synthetase TtcA [Acidobacteriota bacterium]HNG92243.1 tRNA 2-thiocytidine(32) synthetase TtcA [Acidobacteriota bacterium]HNJ43793.1 tRNA 2-thiocytidine(32) synthetase TtcA [Acidobacteriota bacterium]